jgi:DNA-binding CsgD family transcriptional regulator
MTACKKVLDALEDPFDGTTLTDTERKVALLAAQGCTGPEIAEACGMSQAWAALKLRTALARLNLTGKDELTRFVFARIKEVATR